MKKKIIRREAKGTEASLVNLHPLLQRIYSHRGISSISEIEHGLEKLEPFQNLSNINTAVDCLVTALSLGHHIKVIGDFDADGATSTAVAVKCLQLMGAAKVTYLVPNRFEYGYGLTPEIVVAAAESSPDLLITVDNGISSHEGVLKAHELGMKVVITDHHLPGNTLPEADAIVNPNLPNDDFPSKNLAGVGVVFYVMMALRARLRELQWFTTHNIPEINMAMFLDLVALGTVADVVPLDKNNRILIQQGLLRIRAGRVRPGIKALLEIAGKKLNQITTTDLGFAAGPRLNAAGRLVDMSLGIECLLTEDERSASDYAFKLDALNKERQQIESEMREQAMTTLANLQLERLPVGVCLFEPSWHQGIIGILASRVKELVHRPVFAFAIAGEGELKGSGRSIPGLHLRDVLERIATAHPHLILKYGGHAMAAGMSLARENYTEFANLFNTSIAEMLSPESLEGIIHSDGELTASAINVETADILQKAGPWGQGFPEPLFDGHFKVVTQRLLKEKHLKLVLSSLNDYFMVDAIAFNIDPTRYAINENDTVHIAYRLDVNEYKGNRNVQLLIEYFDVI